MHVGGGRGGEKDACVGGEEGRRMHVCKARSYTYGSVVHAWWKTGVRLPEIGGTIHTQSAGHPPRV